MSLDAAKLEKVRELPGGIVQARCPACAEGGHDRTGEHLRIYPDGRFGCCVHPKDKEHRKRIFALAGGKLPLHSSGTFTVRLKAPSAAPSTRSVKAALVFAPQPSPGLRPPSPVPTGEGPGTIGTPKTESESGVPAVPRSLRTATMPTVADFGTLGTGNSELRARARVDSTAHIDIGEDFQEELKDSETAVPSVPKVVVAEPPSAAGAPGGGPPLPYLTPGGTLVIPFDSPERYHWWKLDGERLSVAETLNEVKERMKHAVTV